jgi:hypothetical protein
MKHQMIWSSETDLKGASPLFEVRMWSNSQTEEGCILKIPVLVAGSSETGFRKKAKSLPI